MAGLTQPRLMPPTSQAGSGASDHTLAHSEISRAYYICRDSELAA